MKALESKGSTNRVEVDNYMVDVHVILNFIKLIDQEKLLCSSFVLKNDAHLWWETVQLRHDVSQITWEDFVEEFNEKYFNTK